MLWFSVGDAPTTAVATATAVALSTINDCESTNLINPKEEMLSDVGTDDDDDDDEEDPGEQEENAAFNGK